jgi:cytochrome c5
MPMKFMFYLNKQIYLIFCLILAVSHPVYAEIVASHDDVRKYNLGLGKNIFQTKCIKCHGDLDSDAPQFRNIQDWEARIQMPIDNLVNHAIGGHGEMPAKGGFEELTDRHVAAAVAYVVDQTRRLIINHDGKLALDYKNICEDLKKSCTTEQIDNRVFLELLLLLSNKK